MSFRIIISLVVSILSTHADAAFIKWTYSGAITEAEAGFTSLYDVGGIFSGYFIYDTSSPESSAILSPESNGSIVDYDNAITSGFLSIGDFSLTFENTASGMRVMNDFTNLSNGTFHGDCMIAGTGYNWSGDFFANQISVTFNDATGSVFETSNLPGTNIDTQLFDRTSVVITSTSGTCNPYPYCSIATTISVVGSIDSIQISEVPLPAAIWLFITGLFSIIGISRIKLRGQTLHFTQNDKEQYKL